jgi:hypothetical protein
VVQGRGLPNLPHFAPDFCTGQTNESGGEEQAGNSKRRKRERITYILVPGVLGAEHVRAVRAEPQRGDPCSTNPGGQTDE